MRELGYFGKPLQLRNFERLENADILAEPKVKIIDLETKTNYTIDEILDKVEEGDLSILVELGISYTEITTETGDKKISFKYEGVRYTVNIIKANETEGQTNNNTQTVKNDDGSYTVYEYDENGALIKSTDYDKDGKVTHEFVLKEDGSHSDKYYTYENGSLVSTQETIHYTDGNYTYIFKDADGKLIEEQKVIHNELGGLTFDCTYGDGTRQVFVCDDDGQAVSRTFYTKEGKVEKTQEYNRISSDLYTVVTRNAEGKIIQEEVWENYSYTDDDGLTWHGSRLNKRIDYDENGNITEITEGYYLKDGSERHVFKNANGEITQIIVISKDHKEQRSVTNDDPNFIEELRKLADDLAQDFFGNNVPQLPSREDYATDEEYEQALVEYRNGIKLFEEKIAEYNLSIVGIEYTENITKTKKMHQKFNQKVEKLQLIMQIARKSGKIRKIDYNKLEKVVKMHEMQYEKNISNKYGIFNKIRGLQQKMILLNVPTPPSMTSGMTEEEYEKAFAKYEREQQQYEQKIQEINAELAKMNKQLAQIDMLLLHLEINIQRITDNIAKQMNM